MVSSLRADARFVPSCCPLVACLPGDLATDPCFFSPSTHNEQHCGLRNTNNTRPEITKTLPVFACHASPHKAMLRNTQESSRTFCCGHAPPCCTPSPAHASRNLPETSPCRSSAPLRPPATPPVSPARFGCSSSSSARSRGRAPCMHQICCQHTTIIGQWRC